MYILSFPESNFPTNPGLTQPCFEQPGPDWQRSAHKASMRCNISQDKQRPLLSRHRSRTLEETTLACNLTLPKLHLATYKMEHEQNTFML